MKIELKSAVYYILAHCAIKFLDLNFVCVSEVLTYLDYIFSPALAWDKIKSKKA